MNTTRRLSCALAAACLTLLFSGEGLALEAEFSPDFAITGPDGKVNTALWHEGRWAVAGTFQSVEGQEIHSVATLDTQGWSPLDPLNRLNGTVQALATLPDGRLAVGGVFWEIDGQPAGHLALWDGQQWQGLPGLGQWDRVYALAVDTEGALWVGGDFTEYLGHPANGVMRLVNGVPDTSVGAPLENTGILDPTVMDFSIDDQGRVLVAGWFDRVNGQTSAGVARWDGNSWSRLGATSGSNTSTYAVETRGDEIWVAGTFLTWNGITSNGLMRQAGGQWTAPVSPFVQGLTCLLVTQDEVWAGNGWSGDFVHHHNGEAELVPVLSPEGTGGVSALATDPQGNLLAVGGFAGLDGAPALHAALLPAGGAWQATVDVGLARGLFGAVYYDNASVNRILPLGNGEQLVFGTFQGSGDRLLTSPALYTPAGWQEGPFTTESAVTAALVTGNEVVVGDFGSVRRWDLQLGQWIPMGDPFEGPQGTVEEFVASPDGNTVYAGGYFWLSRDGETVGQSLAVWNRQDDQWSPVGTDVPEAGVNGFVQALALDGQGRLLVGGAITAIDGQPANNIIRWDGSTWNTLQGGLDGQVTALLASGNEIWAAGGFDLEGIEQGLARYDETGGWQPMGNLPTHSVHTLLPLDSGGFLLGGSFTSAGGQTCGGLAWCDGTTFHPLAPAPAPGRTAPLVQALAIDSQTLLVGGTFNSLADLPAHAFCTATLSAPPAPITDLRIRRLGPVLELDWTPVPGAQDYVIRHYVDPVATPESGTVIGTPVDPPFTAPLSAAPTGFYRVSTRVE